MDISSENKESRILGRTAYLWAFIPIVLLASLSVFVVCLGVLIFNRTKAVFA